MDLRLYEDGDLAFHRGDLVLVEGLDEIAQRLRIRLRLFLGEWFLDASAGVPYWQRVLGSKISRAALASIFREQILACPGIEEVLSLDVDMGGAGRAVRITFLAQTAAGELSDSIEVAP